MTAKKKDDTADDTADDTTDKSTVEVETETEEEKKAREEAEKREKEDKARKDKLKKIKAKPGDMVMVDIFGKTIEEEGEGMVFQASNPEDAKLLLNYEEDKKDQYSNELAIIGKKGFLEDKIDEAIQEGLKFFEEKTIELEPEDAFGKREGAKIEKVSAKKFIKDMNEQPQRGSLYRDKKGRTGTVIRAAQGRLLVDFNHPLAGKKVSYRIKLTDKIEGFENQAKALLARRLGGQPRYAEEFKITHNTDTKTMDIEIPQMMMFHLSSQQNGSLYFKMGSSMDMQEHLENVETVRFIEVFEKTPSPTHNHDHDHDHEHEHEDSVVDVQDAEVIKE